jgi:molybdenum cofactor biosynthesis protein B
MSLEAHKQTASAPIRCAVITISDTRNASTDRGGPRIVEHLQSAQHLVARREIVKDEREQIRAAVLASVEDASVDLVITTGGTGIAPRDVTYPVLLELFDSDIPGFGELFRQLSFLEIGSATILSRACAGVVRGKVVIALPGSPKAVDLAMQRIVLPEAGHLVTQSRA